MLQLFGSLFVYDLFQDFLMWSPPAQRLKELWIPKSQKGISLSLSSRSYYILLHCVYRVPYRLSLYIYFLNQTFDVNVFFIIYYFTRLTSGNRAHVLRVRHQALFRSVLQSQSHISESYTAASQYTSVTTLLICFLFVIYFVYQLNFIINSISKTQSIQNTNMYMFIYVDFEYNSDSLKFRKKKIVKN